MNLEERLAAKIERTATCWLWTAAKTSSGYGWYFDAGRGVVAHRAVYERLVGSVPDGLQLDHLCRIRHCVNPAHLEVVTSGENTRRGEAGKYQSRKTACPKGHPYDSENTYVLQGRRYCRACARVRTREINRRKRAEARSIAA